MCSVYLLVSDHRHSTYCCLCQIPFVEFLVICTCCHKSKLSAYDTKVITFSFEITSKTIGCLPMKLTNMQTKKHGDKLILPFIDLFFFNYIGENIKKENDGER